MFVVTANISTLTMKKQHYSFCKQQRLLVSEDFQQVFNNFTFKIHQKNFLLFVKIHSDMTSATSRLGLAITKRKVKRANKRNTIKRLTREYFRLHHHEINIPVDIVLIIKHISDDVSNAVFYQQLQQSFVEINHKLNKYYQASDNRNSSNG